MAVTLDGSNGITTPQILNAGANGSGNIGSANSYFGTLFVTSTTLTNFSATGNISTQQNLIVNGTSTLTGVVTAPTASAATNNTQVATTSYVTSAVSTATASLGTMSTQNSNSVSITGGSITGITDLAVADGGTGRSSLTANNILLGNGTSGLQTVAPGASGNILQSNGSTWVSVINTGITAGQTWQNLTGSRSSDVTYTNTTGRAIYVIAQVGAQTNGVQAYINGELVVRHWYDVNGGAGQVGYSTAEFLVPPSGTYLVTAGPVRGWWEYR